MKAKEDNSDWKFGTTSRTGKYRGTNLSYDMLCDPISSDNGYNKVDKLSNNRLVNLYFWQNT